MNVLRTALFAILALFPVVGSAATSTIPECARSAAQTFAVPDLVLAVVLRVEAGWPGAESRNDNGSYDLGVAQINTIHLPELEKLGITRERLRDDACTNIAVAAFLLRRHFEHRHNWADAITDYHSKTPEHAARYAQLAADALAALKPH